MSYWQHVYVCPDGHEWIEVGGVTGNFVHARSKEDGHGICECGKAGEYSQKRTNECFNSINECKFTITSTTTTCDK